MCPFLEICSRSPTNECLMDDDCRLLQSFFFGYSLRLSEGLQNLSQQNGYIFQIVKKNLEGRPDFR